MALQVLIDNVDRTGVVDLRTLEVEDAVGERTVCRFRVNDLTNSLASVLVPGESVEVALDGLKVFGGTIDRVQRVKPAPGSDAQVYGIECVDWHQVADRRLVAEVYEGVLAGAIVKSIVDKYLAAEGVSYGAATVADGPVITKAVFNYVPASQALEELADLTGYLWWIDANKVLYFADRATYAAPWTLDSYARVLQGTLLVERHRQGYRNRQYIRAGTDVTDVRTEQPSPAPDGQTKVFTLAFPAAKMPTVKVNGVEKTVGIRGVDSGKDWYWSKGDNTISQDDAATPLASTDVLEVTYQGLFPLLVMAEAAEAQTDRQAVEGGTGLYEAVDEKAGLDDRTAALEAAQGLLRRYARIGTTLQFATIHSGLRPGQLLQVNLPEVGAVGEFLVQSVRLSQAAGDVWRYEVRALSGEEVGGWSQFFQRLARQGRTFVIRENEVLVKLKTARDPVKLGDNLVIAKAAPESRVGYAAIGFAEVA